MSIQNQKINVRLRNCLGGYGLKLNQIKVEYIILLLIVILGSALRVYGLDRSLWFDEVLSINSQKDISSLISEIYMPQHLLFVILHFFMLLGNSEIIIRLPSVIFGVAGIFLFYKLGKLFFGRSREGLIGAFLLSISTMHIQYSQEARYYSLTTFFTILSVFFFYKAINKMSKKLWFAYIISTILAVLSHWYMIFVPFIEMTYLTFLLIKHRNKFSVTVRNIGKKKVFFLVLGLIIISLVLIPLIQRVLELFLSGSATGGVSAWGIPPESFYQELFSVFTFGVSFSFLSGLYGVITATSFLYLFIILFIYGIFSLIRKDREKAILLILWVFLPTAIIFLLSFFAGSPVTAAKYLIFILPAYFIGIARGISTISNILLKFFFKIVYGLSSIALSKKQQATISYISIAIILLSFVGLSVAPLSIYYATPQEDWKAAVSYLETNSRPGDVIVIEPGMLQPCLFYYYEQNSTTADYMKSITTTVSAEEYPYNSFLETISKHERTWIIFSPRHERHIYWKVMDWIKNNAMNVKNFTQVSIYYYNSESIVLSTQNMSFIGLDNAPGESVAIFWHNADSATFNVNISRSGNYLMQLHTRSGWNADKGWLGTSSVEIAINGISKATKVYSAENWLYVDLGTLHLDSGLQEITLTCRIGEDLGNTGIQFDQVVITSVI